MNLWMLVGALMWLEVPLQNPGDALRLMATGLDVPYVNLEKGIAHVIVEDRALDKLTASGFSYAVLDYDLRATWRKNFKIAFGPYYTYAEVQARLQQLVSQYGPQNLIQDTVIGYSVEGRPIVAFRISDNVNTDEGEPAVLLTGVHHAREPIGAYITLEFGAWLLDHYATDPVARFLVDHRVLWVVPVVNPDGFVYNESSDGYWRKNKRDNDNNGLFEECCDGVDLNRNYGFMWGYDDVGSSPDSSSNIYRGPAPFSEPETQAIRDLVNTVHPVIALNYHSYSNLLLFPLGHEYNVYAPDDALFRAMSREMTRASGYAFGTPWEILYTANGVSDDWMYADTASHPKVLAFTPEVGEAFWQPDTGIIVEQFNENLPMNLFVMKASGPYLEVDSAYAQPNTYAPGDTLTLWMRVKNFYVGGGISGTGSFSPESTVCAVFPSPTFPVNLAPFPDSVWISVPVIVGDTTPAARYRFVGAFQMGSTSQPFALTVYVGQPAVDTVFSDDFESGLAWNAGGTGGSWGVASPGVSGASSLQDSPGGNYGNSWDTYVWTTVDLTNYDGATLTFTHQYDIESGWDYAYVEASPDGTTWTQLASYTGAQNTWQPEALDLSAFAGGVVYLRFRLVTDYAVTYDGWYVDDVRVVASRYGAPECPTTGVAERATSRNGKIRLVGRTLRLDLPASGPARLVLFNALGRKVREFRLAGARRHTLRLDLSPGTYFFRLSQGVFRKEGRLVLP